METTIMPKKKNKFNQVKNKKGSSKIGLFLAKAKTKQTDTKTEDWYLVFPTGSMAMSAKS